MRLRRHQVIFTQDHLVRVTPSARPTTHQVIMTAGTTHQVIMTAGGTDQVVGRDS